MPERVNLKTSLLIAIIWVVIVNTIATANIIYVNANAPGPTHDGTSWLSAYLSLQDAFDKPPTIGDQIWVAAGVYKPGSSRTDSFEMVNGVTIYGGFPDSGEPNLADRDWQSNETILSGDIGVVGENSDNCYHVFYHWVGLSLDANAVLDGFTVTAGNANGTSDVYHDSGGGMLNYGSSPTIKNCEFSDNSALSNGGAMCNEDSSNPIVTNCTFIANSAGTGGGIYNKVNSNPTVMDCNFNNNEADWYGGGMRNWGNCNPTVTNCNFTDNSAVQNGGGIYNQNNSSPTITSCSFIDNSADTGGGILNYDNCSPTVSNCIFSNNSGCGMCNITLSNPIVTDCMFSNHTANSGSAMNNDDHSSPTIDRCRFYGNTAGWRGGAMTISDYSSPMLTNCVFSGNSTSGEGGGMYISNDSSPTLIHCTFSGNSATGFGGGIYTQDISDFAITNSIFWNNTHSGPLDFSAQIFDFTGIVATMNYSCILGWTPSVGGTGNIATDPNFVDPNGLDNIVGTIDDDLRLSSGSPCIDAADSIVALSLPFDVTGSKRGTDDPATFDTGVNIWGVTVDMGAYEFHTHCISPGNPDIDCNGIVDLKDFAYLADNWLSQM